MNADLGYAIEAERWFCIIAGDMPTLQLSYGGAPVAKERPRIGARGRAYTPSKTRTAEEWLSWHFRARMRNREPLAGNLAIVCVFYRPNRQRIDGDNMLKLVCDAGNLARVWGDDSQLTTKLVRIELDKERPRTEIAIGPLASTLTR